MLKLLQTSQINHSYMCCFICFTEGEIEVVAIKEDQYLEQLALSENFRGRL